MKPLEQRTEIEALVASIFRRFPTLVGFSVEDADDLRLDDVETFPWDAYAADLAGEIAAPLAGLVDEAPAALELLRGRTFARRLH
jgi:hypothetical protein